MLCNQLIIQINKFILIQLYSFLYFSTVRVKMSFYDYYFFILKSNTYHNNHSQK